MSRDGVVEVNALSGESKRVSQRGQDFNLSGQTPEEQSHRAFTPRDARKTRQSKAALQNPTPEPFYDENIEQNGSYQSLHDVKEESSVYEGSSASAQPNSVRHDLRPDAPLKETEKKKRTLRIRRDFAAQADSIYERQANGNFPISQEEPSAKPLSHGESEKRTRSSGVPTGKTRAPTFHEKESALQLEKESVLQVDKESVLKSSEEMPKKLLEHQSPLKEKQRTLKTDSKKASVSKTKRTESPSATKGDVSSSDESSSKKSRLQFALDEKPFSAEKHSDSTNETADGFAQSKTARKRQKKAEQRAVKAARYSQKAETYQKNIPTKKVLTTKKEYGEKTGKVKRKFTFEEQTKPISEHVKGSVASRPARFALSEGGRYVHKKMREVEDENVAVEAAHKGEKLLEQGARKTYRMKKTAPYRKAARFEKKAIVAQNKAQYRKFLAENPTLSTNPVSRLLQKQRIKKQYKEALKQTKRAGKTAKNASTVAVTWTKKLVYFVKSNPKIVLIVAGILLLIAFIMSSVSSCSVIGNGILGGIEGSSYLADDGSINSVEMKYSEWEIDLQEQIVSVKQSHSGYDEYRFQVDDISHNPFELIAYFTAVHGEFTLTEVEGELCALFDEHYSLTFTPETEIRYRSETSTDPATGETVTEQVPYEWNILHVQMTAKNLTDILHSKMNAEQKALFDVLMMTRGNRQYTFSPVNFDWLSYISRGYGYYTDPQTGKKSFHNGVDIEVAAGTDILAAYDGTVIKTGTDAKMGHYILIDHGKGLQTYYAHCQSILVQTGQVVKQGEKIALVGNSGQSQKPHLHFEVRLNGSSINPLFFTDTGGETKVDENGQPVIPDYPGEAMTDAKYKAMMDEAQKHLGKPYVFGSSGPDTFDCSGFICWVSDKSGVYPTGRTNAQGLYNQCTPVSAQNAKPGDLIFFQGTYSTSNTVTHIGIYVGNGQMIHCGNPIQYTSINTDYWKKHFYAFGRLGS